MATGLPVVVGAVGGIPELIKEGETGFLVPVNDQRVLAEKLDLLIGDAGLRLRVGRAARKACEENLNIERQLRQIIAVVDRDASSPRPPFFSSALAGSFLAGQSRLDACLVYGSKKATVLSEHRSATCS
jgi:hypothetical protein